MTLQTYFVFVLKPTLATPGGSPGVYKYDSIDTLSRFALNVYAEVAAGPNAFTFGTRETALINGQAVPGSPSYPFIDITHPYNNPAISTTSDARNYLDDICYTPQTIPSPTYPPFNAVEWGGVYINNTPCYICLINLTRPTHNNYGVILDVTFQGTANPKWTNNVFQDIFTGANATDVQAGDRLRLFLVEASRVQNSLHNAGIDYSNNSPGSPVPGLYNILHSLSENPFELVDGGNTWVFTQDYVVNPEDFGSSSTTSHNFSNVYRTIKPAAASENAFEFAITATTIANAPLPTGLEIAVVNKRLLQGNPPDNYYVPLAVFQALGFGTAGTNSTHAAIAGDEVKFFVRRIDTKVPVLFNILVPFQHVSSEDPNSIVVTDTDIINFLQGESGPPAVTLQLGEAVQPQQGSIQVFGQIINGPPTAVTPIPIPSGTLQLVVDVNGVFAYRTTFDATNIDALTGHGTFNFTIGQLTPLQPGDVIDFEVIDVNTVTQVNLDSAKIGAVPEPVLNRQVRIVVTTPMIFSQSITGQPGQQNPVGGSGLNIKLREPFAPGQSVSSFKFFGTIFNLDDNLPIGDGLRLLIHNVDKGLMMVSPVGRFDTANNSISTGKAQGEYEATFTSASFGLSAETPIASTGDQIRYVLFQDLAPFLPSVMGGNTGFSLQYPDRQRTNPVVTFRGEPDGNKVLVAGPGLLGRTFAVVDNGLTLADILGGEEFGNPNGQRREDFTATFVPLILGELEVISKPLPVPGNKKPKSVLPYIDMVFPQNIEGLEAFEFSFQITRNALDPIPTWEDVLDVPDILIAAAEQRSIAPPPDGTSLMFPGSAMPLRLHVFEDAPKTTRQPWALALKVKMKLNDAVGPYLLRAWGFRFWNAD